MSESGTPEAARCPTCDAAHRNCDWCDAACSDPWHTPGMNAAICPTCGSDDPNRFDDGCADTGQPVGMDLGGHLIYGEPDAWHGVQDE